MTPKPNSTVSTPMGPGRLIGVRWDGRCQVALHRIPEADQKNMHTLGLISNVRTFELSEVKQN